MQWLNDFLFTIYWGRNAPELYVDGWDWVGWDLCVGLLYLHRFAVLITKTTKKTRLELIIAVDNIPTVSKKSTSF